MFIAHMPAGYLLTRRLVRSVQKPQAYWLLAFGLFASILPDLDLLYFYFVDNRQYNHHTYWTHWPLFWVAVMLGVVGMGYLLKCRLLRWMGVVLGAATLLHMALDTVAGGIMWLAPFSSDYTVLAVVKNRYTDWGWNFLLHWTFLLELLIVLLAAVRGAYSIHYARFNNSQFNTEP